MNILVPNGLFNDFWNWYPPSFHLSLLLECIRRLAYLFALLRTNSLVYVEKQGGLQVPTRTRHPNLTCYWMKYFIHKTYWRQEWILRPASVEIYDGRWTVFERKWLAKKCCGRIYGIRENSRNGRCVCYMWAALECAQRHIIFVACIFAFRLRYRISN
jgi:hypothetical protein